MNTLSKYNTRSNYKSQTQSLPRTRSGLSYGPTESFFGLPIGSITKPSSRALTHSFPSKSHSQSIRKPKPKPFISQITYPDFNPVFNSADRSKSYDREHITQANIATLRTHADKAYNLTIKVLQQQSSSYEKYKAHWEKVGGNAPRSEARDYFLKEMEDTKLRVETSEKECQEWTEILELINQMEEIRTAENWA